jgi:hypothetical protein
MRTCVQTIAARREGGNDPTGLILEQMFSFDKGWGTPDPGFNVPKGQAGK